MTDTLTPGERLQRDVARDWLDRCPAVLAFTDQQVAEAAERGDTEAMNRWLDWRANAEHLAELARVVLERSRG